MSAAPLNRVWNGTRRDDKHLRGMSDSAPLYALIILAGIVGGIVCLIGGTLMGVRTILIHVHQHI